MSINCLNALIAKDISIGSVEIILIAISFKTLSGI